MSTLSQYNSQVNEWTRGTTRKMKNQVLRLVLSIGPGHNNLKGSTQNYLGEARKIGFRFPYYMVFVHKGAGRGYGGNKTGSYFNKKGGRSATNTASKGKMGTGKRRPKPWFNPVIEKQFPELSDIVANYRGEKITLQIKRILID